MLKKIALRGLKTVTVFYVAFLFLFGLSDAVCRIEAAQIESEEALACFAKEGEKRVVLGGELFGLRLQTKGLLVTSLEKVLTKEGEISPGVEAGLKAGDVILSAGGVSLSDAASFAKIVSRSKGEAIALSVLRGEDKLDLVLKPLAAADESGYKAGLWVRDGAAGIGTVTFRDPEGGNFVGLGHGVCDSVTGALFPLGKGEICEATADKIKKGAGGAPGELRGSLSPTATGELLANTPQGVYGTLSKWEKAETVPVGTKADVKVGKATILSTLDGEGKKEYEVTVEEVFSEDRKTKNFILRITSPELLEKTGGIIQGMSGSPIVQDGKLIGAITHVLVGDPTRGYGIFIENMLETAQSVREGLPLPSDNEQLKEAS